MGNSKQPILDVEHFRLDPADRRANGWASVCPACGDGLLLVRRDPETFLIQQYDLCAGCGQRVRYLDVDDMRRKDWAR